MKKVFTILVIVAMSICAFGQSPQKMSYQAIIRDANNTLIRNQNIGMRISILQGSVNGTTVYTETQTSTTNMNGLISIEIGTGAEFDKINWATGPYFLKTETDPGGGTNYTISGTSQLLSVPYALHSKTAENGFSGSYNDLNNKPVLFDGNYNSLVNKPLITRETTDEFYTVTGQTTFTLTHTPSETSNLKMNINGVRISNSAYRYSGVTLTYIPANNGSYALMAGDRIQFDYSY